PSTRPVAPLSLHDALPIFFTTVRESISAAFPPRLSKDGKAAWLAHMEGYAPANIDAFLNWYLFPIKGFQTQQARLFSFDLAHMPDRKSTRLNSSHVKISYA